jgi:hypothetical protein
MYLELPPYDNPTSDLSCWKKIVGYCILIPDNFVLVLIFFIGKGSVVDRPNQIILVKYFKISLPSFLELIRFR